MEQWVDANSTYLHIRVAVDGAQTHDNHATLRVEHQKIKVAKLLLLLQLHQRISYVGRFTMVDLGRVEVEEETFIMVVAKDEHAFVCVDGQLLKGHADSVENQRQLSTDLACVYNCEKVDLPCVHG